VLFGNDYGQFQTGLARSWDERNLERLSWFLSYPVVAGLAVGLAVVALRRWSASLWLLTAPLLAFLPLYAYRSRNSPRLMWWTRRFVPTVVPLALVLTALVLGLAIALLARHWLRWAAAGAAVLALAGLLAFYLVQSLPLRSHDEFGGSFGMSRRIAAAAGGQQGVFLWQRAPGCCLYAQQLFGAAIWLERNQISALLPDDPAAVPQYLADFQRGFPGQPVFVIWHGQDPPPLPGVRLAAVDHVVDYLPYWEETLSSRPDKAVQLPVSFTIYRVQ
jgi:multisubunit Na+/H+ antiporter MnhC subunit